MMRMVAVFVLPLLAITLPAQGLWVESFPSSAPTARDHHGLAFHAFSRRVVLFGGHGGTASLSDTWEWDGNEWTQRFPTDSPSARFHFGMTYDSARQRIVLFGGVNDAGTLLSDTWEWDGNEWTQRFYQRGPSGRFASGALAFDAIRGRVVLFGGAGQGQIPMADTWEWNGSNSSWVERIPANSPPPRYLHSMVYDAARTCILLFGGVPESGFPLNDTWEWDGMDWVRRFPTPHPPGLAGHSLAYDAGNKQVILFSGVTRSEACLTSTWQWDGRKWTQRFLTTKPFPRAFHRLAYDSVRERAVLFGGQVCGLGNYSDTWEYGNLPHSELFGSGCPGSEGMPKFDAARGSLPRIGETFTLELTSLPATVFKQVIGVLGLSRTAWVGHSLPRDLAFIGAPGCTQHVSVDVFEQLPNQYTHASWALAIPNDRSLLNLEFFAQAMVIDYRPQLNTPPDPIRYSVTSAIQAAIGRE